MPEMWLHKGEIVHTPQGAGTFEGAVLVTFGHDTGRFFPAVSIGREMRIFRPEDVRVPPAKHLTKTS